MIHDGNSCTAQSKGMRQMRGGNVDMKATKSGVTNFTSLFQCLSFQNFNPFQHSNECLKNQKIKVSYSTKLRMLVKMRKKSHHLKEDGQGTSSNTTL